MTNEEFLEFIEEHKDLLFEIAEKDTKRDELGRHIVNKED